MRSNRIVDDSGAQPLSAATINDDWDGNDYFQKIGGAEYYIDTPPWAGGAPLPLSPSDGSFDSPTENVQATIDTRGLSVGQHIIFIRGQGHRDLRWKPELRPRIGRIPAGSPVGRHAGCERHLRAGRDSG